MAGHGLHVVSQSEEEEVVGVHWELAARYLMFVCSERHGDLGVDWGAQ